MVKRMLIDATHSEETRVVVVNGNRLEEFDFETSTKKQLKGNIYLAKVTRVEPSLQAAFVDYGGNRHGFLAFSEIHPDYYRIPIEDRKALLAEADVGTALDDEDEDDPENNPKRDDAPRDAADERTTGAEDRGDDKDDEDDEDDEDDDKDRVQVDDPKPLETLGGDDVEDIQARNRRFQRRYRIQEVISRRQILLVQVTKEERGNKGAALTTYISLAGRYCVLMPNTPRGGGISRKISNPADRKKLKGIVEELDIPPGMAVIVRTAGSKRTKAEIRRDYDFLIRLWDQIRETTLNSTAPALVYEEANLIKRSLRDVYTKDIDEIFVEGDDGYKAAKAFMKQLIPSHAKRVQAYTDPSIPLFHRYQVESQLDNIHSPTVQLKSGGYIVMNSTEALVAIDVNSGKSTRERNIEETAYRTNLEAAEEIGRQLRLRDLAGLIVIDFIDMEESRNRHNVERKLKEAMRSDRARIQLGRISPFGLLELSRQRLRPSILEASAQACPTCAGTGIVRSTESTALHVLRAIEEEGMRQRTSRITIYVPTSVAFYILNQKRSGLTDIEQRYGFEVLVEHDDSLVPPDFRLEREAGRDDADEDEARDKPRAEARRDGAERDRGRRRGGRRRRDTDEDADRAADGAREEEAEEARADDRGDRRDDDDQEQREQRGRRRGRRGGRRRRRGRDREAEDGAPSAAAADDGDVAAQPIDDEDQSRPDTDAAETDMSPSDATAEDAAGAKEKEKEKEKPRRRSRRRAEPADNAPTDAATKADTTPPDANAAAAPAPESTDTPPAGDEEAAKKPRRRRAPKAKPAKDMAVDDAPDKSEAKTSEGDPAETTAPAKPKAPRRRRKPAAKDETKDEAKEASNDAGKTGTSKTGTNGAKAPDVAAAPAAQDTGPQEKPDAGPVIDTANGAEAKDKPKKRRRGWWSLGG